MKSKHSYAGFWRRVVALIIDSIVLLPIWIIIGFFYFEIFVIINNGEIMGMPNPRHMQVEVLSPEAQATMQLYSFGVFFTGILACLYFAFMESSKYQGTVGKIVMDIKVTDMRGKRLSFARAIGRTFAKYISILPCYIGFFFAAFTPKKQALHDMVAGCLVLSKIKYVELPMSNEENVVP